MSNRHSTMSVVTSEVEISSTLPAPKLFKAYNDFDNIGPKVDPQTYKSVQIIQGDGGVGTIKNITFGDGVPYTSGKSKTDVVDCDNHALSYTIFEGDVLLGVLDSSTHHIKFVPSADGGSVYKHTIMYNCKGDAKLTEEQLNHGKEALTKTFKAIEAYVQANPSAY